MEERGIESRRGQGQPLPSRQLKPRPKQKAENREYIRNRPELEGKFTAHKSGSGPFVRTLIDDDEVHDVIQDAVVGSMRRSDQEEEEEEEAGQQGSAKSSAGKHFTDVMVGATRATTASIMTAMGGNGGAAVPPDWTNGYTVRSRSQRVGDNGNKIEEAGWDMDPATIGLVGASIHRMTLLPGTSRRTKKVIEHAYSTAHSFFKNVAESGKQLRYDFKPRGAVQTTTVLPLLLSIRYELASRAFDRMWTLLHSSREVSGRHAFEQVLIHNTGIPQEWHETIREGLERAQIARSPPLRLVMRSRGIQRPPSTGAVAAQPPSIENSFFFGTAHRTVEREILDATLQPALRYMMDIVSGSTHFRGHPAFTFRLERVRVRGNFDREKYGKQFEATTNGLRVTIPPASQGYRRGSVVFLLRSDYKDEGEEGSAEAVPRHETDIILVGHVPDDSKFEPVPPEIGGGGGAGFGPPQVGGGPPQQGSLMSVSDIPASFVFFDGQAENPDIDIHSAGHVVPTVVDAAQGSYRYNWNVLYDLAWLEQVSGYFGQFHPVSNDRFHRAAEGYFRVPSSDRMPLLTDPHIEVFVEYIPTPEKLESLRAERRQWMHDPALTEFEDPMTREHTGYFPVPQSFTAMRNFALRLETSVAPDIVHKGSLPPLQPQPQQSPQQQTEELQQAARMMSREDREIWSLQASVTQEEFAQLLASLDEGEEEGQLQIPVSPPQTQTQTQTISPGALQMPPLPEGEAEGEAETEGGEPSTTTTTTTTIDPDTEAYFENILDTQLEESEPESETEGPPGLSDPRFFSGHPLPQPSTFPTTDVGNESFVGDGGGDESSGEDLLEDFNVGTTVRNESIGAGIETEAETEIQAESETQAETEIQAESETEIWTEREEEEEEEEKTDGEEVLETEDEREQ